MRFGVVGVPGTRSDCDFPYLVSEVLPGRGERLRLPLGDRGGPPGAGEVRLAPGAEPRGPRLRDPAGRLLLRRLPARRRGRGPLAYRGRAPRLRRGRRPGAGLGPRL